MPIDFQQYECVRDATRVSRYRDAEQILVDRGFVSGAFESESAPFKKDTIFEINGTKHRERRRGLSPLFTRSGAASYESETLEKSIGDQLHELAKDASGVERISIDLVKFTRLAMVAVAARIIGIDADNRTERLMELADPIGMAADVKWSDRAHEEVLAEGHRAKQAFQSEFLLPALDEQSKAPQAANLVSTMVANLDPADLSDVDVVDEIAREAMIFLTAGVRTTAHAVSHTVHELRLNGGPPLVALTNEDLRAAANEALRLHPPAPALVREATQDATLASGLNIRAGERVAIDLESCNRDVEVFGADATAFMPSRDLPTGVHSYGLSFGAGPHVCLGKGLSVSSTSTNESDGSLRTVVRVLSTLRDLGLVPSETEEPVQMQSGQDRWESYPVTLQGDLVRDAWK